MKILIFHFPSCPDDHLFVNRLVFINEYLCYFSIIIDDKKFRWGNILEACCLVYMKIYILVDFIVSIDGIGPHHFIIFSKISSAAGGHVTRLLINRIGFKET